MTTEPPATEFWGLLKPEEAADFLALARPRSWPRGAVICQNCAPLIPPADTRNVML